MTLRIRCLVVVFGFSFCAGAGIAQDQPPTVAQEQPLTSDKIALTVKPGVPIRVALEKSLPIKQAGGRWKGTLSSRFMFSTTWLFRRAPRFWGT